MKAHVLMALCAPVALLTLTGMYQGSGFNQNGNILIADQFNNRVIEVDPAGNIVWQFGSGLTIANKISVVAPNDAERVGTDTLISGTGAPPGATPQCPAGCVDNRVLLVDQTGKIVWQYGQAGVTGSGFNQLNTPVAAIYLSNGDVMITDQGNQRIIEVNAADQIVWQYGTTGVAGYGPNLLNNPNSAEVLTNGDILIADEGNNRAFEIDASGNIVWSYGNPSDTSLINGAAFASRLPNGDTLISDAGNNRIIEVSPDDVVVRAYYTNTRPGSVENPNPTRGLLLSDGDWLISDQFNDQVISVNADNQIDWTFGIIGVPIAGLKGLNAPYDAKMIGDYTGLTPPKSIRP